MVKIYKLSNKKNVSEFLNSKKTKKYEIFDKKNYKDNIKKIIHKQNRKQFGGAGGTTGQTTPEMGKYEYGKFALFNVGTAGRKAKTQFKTKKFDVFTKEQYFWLKRNIYNTIRGSWLLQKIGKITEEEHELLKRLLKAHMYFARIKLVMAKLYKIIVKLYGSNESIIRKMQRNIRKVFDLQMDIEYAYKNPNERQTDIKSGVGARKRIINFFKGKIWGPKTYEQFVHTIIKKQDKLRKILMKQTIFNSTKDLGSGCNHTGIILGKISNKFRKSKNLICAIGRYRKYESKFNKFYYLFREQYKKFIRAYPACDNTVDTLVFNAYLNIDEIEEKKDGDLYYKFEPTKCDSYKLKKGTDALLDEAGKMLKQQLGKGGTEDVKKEKEIDAAFSRKGVDLKNLMTDFTKYINVFKKMFQNGEAYGIRHHHGLPKKKKFVDRIKGIFGKSKEYTLAKPGRFEELAKEPTFIKEFTDTIKGFGEDVKSMFQPDNTDKKIKTTIIPYIELYKTYSYKNKSGTDETFNVEQNFSVFSINLNKIQDSAYDNNYFYNEALFPNIATIDRHALPVVVCVQNGFINRGKDASKVTNFEKGFLKGLYVPVSYSYAYNDEQTIDYKTYNILYVRKECVNNEVNRVDDIIAVDQTDYFTLRNIPEGSGITLEKFNKSFAAVNFNFGSDRPTGIEYIYSYVDLSTVSGIPDADAEAERLRKLTASARDAENIRIRLDAINDEISRMTNTTVLGTITSLHTELNNLFRNPNTSTTDKNRILVLIQNLKTKEDDVRAKIAADAAAAAAKAAADAAAKAAADAAAKAVIKTKIEKIINDLNDKKNDAKYTSITKATEKAKYDGFITNIETLFKDFDKKILADAKILDRNIDNIKNQADAFYNTIIGTSPVGPGGPPPYSDEAKILKLRDEVNNMKSFDGKDANQLNNEIINLKPNIDTTKTSEYNRLVSLSSNAFNNFNSSKKLLDKEIDLSKAQAHKANIDKQFKHLTDNLAAAVKLVKTTGPGAGAGATEAAALNQIKAEANVLNGKTLNDEINALRATLNLLDKGNKTQYETLVKDSNAALILFNNLKTQISTETILATAQNQLNDLKTQHNILQDSLNNASLIKKKADPDEKPDPTELKIFIKEVQNEIEIKDKIMLKLNTLKDIDLKEKYLKDIKTNVNNYNKYIDAVELDKIIKSTFETDKTNFNVLKILLVKINKELNILPEDKFSTVDIGNDDFGGGALPPKKGFTIVTTELIGSRVEDLLHIDDYSNLRVKQIKEITQKIRDTNSFEPDIICGDFGGTTEIIKPNMLTKLDELYKAKVNDIRDPLKIKNLLIDFYNNGMSQLTSSYQRFPVINSTTPPYTNSETGLISNYIFYKNGSFTPSASYLFTNPEDNITIKPPPTTPPTTPPTPPPTPPTTKKLIDIYGGILPIILTFKKTALTNTIEEKEYMQEKGRKFTEVKLYNRKSLEKIIRMIDKLMSQFTYGYKAYLKRDLGCFSFQSEDSDYSIREKNDEDPVILKNFYTMNYPSFIDVFLYQLSGFYNDTNDTNEIFYSENQISRTETKHTASAKLNFLEGKGVKGQSSLIKDTIVRMLLIPSKELKLISAVNTTIAEKGIDFEKTSAKDYMKLAQQFSYNFYREYAIPKLESKLKELIFTNKNTADSKDDRYTEKIQKSVEDDIINRGLLYELLQTNTIDGSDGTTKIQELVNIKDPKLIERLFEFIFVMLKLKFIDKQVADIDSAQMNVEESIVKAEKYAIFGEEYNNSANKLYDLWLKLKDGGLTDILKKTYIDEIKNIIVEKIKIFVDKTSTPPPTPLKYTIEINDAKEVKEPTEIKTILELKNVEAYVAYALMFLIVKCILTEFTTNINDTLIVSHCQNIYNLQKTIAVLITEDRIAGEKIKSDINLLIDKYFKVYDIWIKILTPGSPIFIAATAARRGLGAASGPGPIVPPGPGLRGLGPIRPGPGPGPGPGGPSPPGLSYDTSSFTNGIAAAIVVLNSAKLIQTEITTFINDDATTTLKTDAEIDAIIIKLNSVLVEVNNQIGFTNQLKIDAQSILTGIPSTDIAQINIFTGFVTNLNKLNLDLRSIKNILDTQNTNLAILKITNKTIEDADKINSAAITAETNGNAALTIAKNASGSTSLKADEKIAAGNQANLAAQAATYAANTITPALFTSLNTAKTNTAAGAKQNIITVLETNLKAIKLRFEKLIKDLLAESKKLLASISPPHIPNPLIAEAQTILAEVIASLAIVNTTKTNGANYLLASQKGIDDANAETDTAKKTNIATIALFAANTALDNINIAITTATTEQTRIKYITGKITNALSGGTISEPDKTTLGGLNRDLIAENANFTAVLVELSNTKKQLEADIATLTILQALTPDETPIQAILIEGQKLLAELTSLNAATIMVVEQSEKVIEANAALPTDITNNKTIANEAKTKVETQIRLAEDLNNRVFKFNNKLNALDMTSIIQGLKDEHNKLQTSIPLSINNLNENIDKLKAVLKNLQAIIDKPDAPGSEPVIDPPGFPEIDKMVEKVKTNIKLISNLFNEIIIKNNIDTLDNINKLRELFNHGIIKNKDSDKEKSEIYKMLNRILFLRENELLCSTDPTSAHCKEILYELYPFEPKAGGGSKLNSNNSNNNKLTKNNNKTNKSNKFNSNNNHKNTKRKDKIVQLGGAIGTPPPKKTIQLENKTINNLIEKEKGEGNNLYVLNFASIDPPGGQVENGFMGEEEELCRTSPQFYNSLKNYFSAVSARENTFIITRNVTFIRNDGCHKDPYDIFPDSYNKPSASIISMFTPNISEEKIGFTDITTSPIDFGTDKKTINTFFNEFVQKITLLLTKNPADTTDKTKKTLIIGTGIFGEHFAPKDDAMKNNFIQYIITKILEAFNSDNMEDNCVYDKILFAIPNKPNHTPKIFETFKTLFIIKDEKFTVEFNKEEEVEEEEEEEEEGGEAGETEPLPEVTYDKLLVNYNKVINTFPKIENWKIKELFDDKKDESKQMWSEYASEVKPIVSENFVKLLEDFIAIQNEKTPENELYKDMKINDLITRLLTKRPHYYYYLPYTTYNYGYYDVSNNLVSGKKFEDLNKKNFLDYDEIALSALISVSVPTKFINNGSITNNGLEDTNHYENKAIYTACVGPRLDKDTEMEHSYIFVTKEQNTTNNGYGIDEENIKKLASETDKYLAKERRKILQMWAKFYGYADEMFPTWDEMEAKTDSYMGFEKLNYNPNYYFNADIYKKRIKQTILPFLCNANDYGKTHPPSKKAFLRVVGLGKKEFKYGIMNYIKIDEYMVEVYKEILKEHKFENISCIEFIDADIEKPEEIIEGITFIIKKNNGNPADKLPYSQYMKANNISNKYQNDLLVTMYDWDSFSYPGNKFWDKTYNKDSTNKAAACCSMISILQNPDINPTRLTGEATYFVKCETDTSSGGALSKNELSKINSLNQKQNILKSKRTLKKLNKNSSKLSKRKL